MYYYSLNEYLKKTFGEKVYKISLDGGMTCPNRDGTLGRRGCIFCSGGGSGEFSADRNLSITEQLEQAKTRIRQKTDCRKFIAYFQPFTNTYADVSYLRRIFYEAILPEEIAVLSIATRPDCLGTDVLELLSELNKIKPVWVELGLQTVHAQSAEYIRRGYPLETFDEAVSDLRKNGVSVITHVILGLKLQLLHVLRGTDLLSDYENGEFETLSLEQYLDILCDAVEVLPENTVIHRLTGDGDKKLLVAPLWSADKKRVLNEMNREFRRRDVVQGRKYKNFGKPLDFSK